MALKLCLQLNSLTEVCLKTYVWEALQCCGWYDNWISQLETLCSENVMFITYKTGCSTSPLASKGCWMADAAKIMKPFTWQDGNRKVVVAFSAIQQPFWFGRVIYLLSQVFFHSCMVLLAWDTVSYFFSPALSAAVCDSSCALEIACWFKMQSDLWSLRSNFPLYFIFVPCCFL